MKIAGISSTKLSDPNEGHINNKNLYNDKELIDEADLNWYDYGFRNYDAQIGRFPQLDPLTDDYPELTPYQYGSNDPIANIDLDGLEGVYSVTVKTVVKHTSQAASVGSGIGKGLSLAGIGASIGNIASNVSNKISEQASIAKWNASNRWNNFGQAVSDKFDDIKAGVEIAAEEEGKTTWLKWIEAGLDIDTRDPNSIFFQADLGPVGRFKGGMKNVFRQEIKITKQIDDFNQARNKALEWLEERGFEAKEINYGGVKKTQGKPVGMKGTKAGFRVEYDSKNGAHINVYSGKEKGPHFKFNASEKTVQKIQMKYGKR